jgi:hypothetical protein
MYDEKKLNKYWQLKKAIEREWRRNGWDGDLNNTGREITYGCGCSCWAGWGVSIKRFCDGCVSKRENNDR